MLSLLSGEGDDIQWRGIAVVDDEVTDAELERMHALGVRGIRLNLLFKGGINLDTGLRLGHRIVPLGWHVQFLIDVSEFPGLARRLEQLPVPSVIDHMGHMPAAKSAANPGFRDFLALVREGQIWVKLSGAYRLTGRQHPPYTDVDPIAHALIEANPERLLFGTDWPHPGIRIPMPNDGDLMIDFLRWMDNDVTLTNRVLVENPAELYEF
jgi:predicted TIM-barrel fold metal-dependent hydrolase